MFYLYKNYSNYRVKLNAIIDIIITANNSEVSYLKAQEKKIS